MDQAAEQKLKKSLEACRAAGWSFQPFVADTYGALRADARDFVKRVIKRYNHKVQPLDEAEAGRAIWSTVSAAVMSRAAQQLSRLTALDSPLGMPPHALRLHTCRQRSSTLPSTTPRLNDMGINQHQLQPSQSEEDDDNLFDFPPQAVQPDSEMKEQNNPPSLTATTAAAANKTIPKRLIVASGQSIPFHITPGDTLSDIGHFFSRVFNLNPSSYTLFLGTQPIQPGIALADQGVTERCELLFHRKPSE